MSDKIFTGLQIPNLDSGQARNPDAGFLRLYAKNDNLYAVLPDGTDVQLTGLAGGAEGFPLFIQDDPPVTNSQKYMWLQTNFQEPGGFTIWFEDGEP